MIKKRSSWNLRIFLKLW